MLYWLVNINLLVEYKHMAGGRPTKYSEEMLEKAKNYLDNHTLYDDIVPSIEGLAFHLELSPKTLLSWGKDEDKKEFLRTLDLVRTKQAKLLLSGGLKGDFTTPITKLMLYNHGYSEKVEQDNTSSDGSMRPTVVQLVGKNDEG